MHYIIHVIKYRKKAILPIILIVLLLAGTQQAVWAESEDEKEPEPDKIEKFKTFITKKRVNAAYLMFGGSRLELDAMNDYLHSNDLPTISKTDISYGVGGHLVFNKLVLGMEIARFSKKEVPGSKDFNTTVSTKYTVLNCGYLLHSNNGRMIYPYMGIGVGELKLKITENTIGSFDDIITFQKSTVARRFAFLMNAGVAFDFFHKYDKRKKGKNSLMIGIRAGYLFTPIRPDWRINRIRVTDGPDSAVQGPYLRIIIGLGGWIETLIKRAI